MGSSFFILSIKKAVKKLFLKLIIFTAIFYKLEIIAFVNSKVVALPPKSFVND